MIKSIKSAVIFAVLTTLCACTILKNTTPQAVQSELGSNNKQRCMPALNNLDQLAFQSAGTLTANRVPTKPWLRYSRLITDDIQTQTSAKNLSERLQKMSSLAKKGLSHELAAVPEASIKQWRQQYQISMPTDRFIEQCSATLIAAQSRFPEATLAMLKAIAVDNDYSTPARVAGLYPLATIPFRLGVVKEQRQLAKEWGQVSGNRWYQYKADLKPGSNLKTKLSSRGLLAQHAPVWLVDSNTRPNLPGAPFWQGETLEVNTQRPTTYAFVSEARWQQQPIMQLNYVIWFSERPRLKRLDWVAGQHDAVVFRVNLDQKGDVIAYDSIHLCGCWYRLFLPEGRPFKRNNQYWREPVLMQRVRLPAGSSQRMAVYLQADTHQIQYLQPAAKIIKQNLAATPAKNYQLKSFLTLLTLPSDRGIRPVFNRRGYVSGSERPERWLFWPMGVKNPGALRRFGDHAISFVGRRYFDDPHLLEKVSGLKPAQTAYVRAKQ